MTDITTLLTIADLRPVLERIVTENPDTVNPRSGGVDPDEAGCLYTAEDDPSRHCLIGQLAAEMGWAVPGAFEYRTAHSAADFYHWPVTPDAAGWLARVQSKADVRGRTWGDPSILAAIQRGY